MKAMTVNEKQELVLTDVPVPEIGEFDARVRVRAAGVNRADLAQRQGNYPSPPGWPEWPGLEIAGEIEAVGSRFSERSAFRPGDRVCALLGGGGYAEYAAVRYDLLMPVPKGLSVTEAAALPEIFATAYLNLFIEGGLQAEQTAFIPAGASGLASAAIPLAKAFGARVVTSVRRSAQVEAARALGADVVIDASAQPVEEALKREAENGTPVQVAMDCLGGETPGRCLPYMARGGRWIVISTLAGAESEIPLRALLSKGLRLSGSTLRTRSTECKAAILAKLVEEVWPKIERGEIRPGACRVLPLEEAMEAHAILSRGGNVGKLVLRVD